MREIAAQLDAGRVFARDLPDLGTALNELNAAYQRCQHTADHAADRLVRVAGAAPDQD